MKAGFLPMRLRESFDHLKRVAEVGRNGYSVAASTDFLLPHRSASRNLTRLQEVVAHHRLRCLTMGRFAIAQSWRYLFLVLVGEDVEVSLHLEVQERPH